MIIYTFALLSIQLIQSPRPKDIRSLPTYVIIFIGARRYRVAGFIGRSSDLAMNASNNQRKKRDEEVPWQVCQDRNSEYHQGPIFSW